MSIVLLRPAGLLPLEAPAPPRVDAAVALVASLRGYAGDVNAFVLDEALTKDKRAFLVDTRGEAQRASDGVPDLRGAARARGAAVPVEPLEASVRNRVKKSARALELELAAKKVAVLTRNDARVYVMRPDAGALARAVQALPGRRSHRVCPTRERRPANLHRASWQRVAHS